MRALTAAKKAREKAIKKEEEKRQWEGSGYSKGAWKEIKKEEEERQAAVALNTLNVSKAAEAVFEAYDTGDARLTLKRGKALVGKLNVPSKYRMAMTLCLLQFEEHVMAETYNKKESN